MGCDFGKRIYCCRRRQKLALEELAVKARMHWSVLLDIENGVHFPTLYQLERLLTALTARWPDVLAACECVDAQDDCRFPG